ncbi:hypothetical protein SO694_00078126 [Aureococcus anophagefferens]|uniref:Borealin N-terminal domain-containing protein n=1 Tax=Aureococcus anophagefferens TaxID=44056 RepID=A0ABR1FH24_AURAN
MPPKTRKRRGKALVAAVAEDAPENKAEQNQTVSPEYLETVIGELEHESERRVKKLKRAMGDMRQEFLNHFQVELLKIPRKIREMKVDHFSSEFGGCMEEALKKAAQWEVEKVVPTSASPDPEMKADAISHLQSLQDEISKAMKSLQQAAS